jgi:hypothetical protein
MMKVRRAATLALAAIVAAWAALPARAELLDAEGNAPGIESPAPVLDDVGFITGNSTTSTAFSITASGTYTVTLTDLLFPDPFQSLALAITSGLRGRPVRPERRPVGRRRVGAGAPACWRLAAAVRARGAARQASLVAAAQ